MSMKKLMVFLGLIFLGMTAFAQQSGMAKADLSSEENAIREISKNWLELDKNHDVNGIVSLFATDAVLYRPNLEPVTGLDAIKKHFAESYEKNPNEIVNWSTDRVDVASSGDLAVEYGKFDVKNSGSDGKKTDKGTYVTVYRKENGKWKVIADAVNSSKPEDSLN